MGTMWTLKVMVGPDQGRSWLLEDLAARRALIGSAEHCAVRLGDEMVSRRHAALEQDAIGLRIVDLDSRNGTWLGKTRVRDAYVVGGETVRVGSTTLTVETDGVMKELAVSPDAAFGSLIGMSPQMRALYPALAQLADGEQPVLLEGETGTGKDVLAEALHQASERRAKPFVVFDCTSIADGAALAQHFEDAREGTILIDALAELNLALQPELLGLLDTPNGPRVLAATRRDLDREVQAGRFREDLYRRISVTRVELPPLRKRAGDILFLARFMLMRMGGDGAKLTPPTIAHLEAYDWPGNVRELENAIAHLVELGSLSLRPPPPAPSSSTDYLDDVVRANMTFPLARDKVVEEFTRRYVEHMLSLHSGNVTRAAAAAGIGRRYFQMVRGKV
jgi:DNA-binding NtrC family response regulator